jgi:Zn-dependent protease
MSLAGPGANFLVAALALVGIWVGLAVGWFQPTDAPWIDRMVLGTGSFSALAKILSIALMLNVVLGVFNLLPVPPLDGHAAVPLFLPDRYVRTWHDWMRTIGFMGIVLAWLAMDRIFPPLFRLVLQVVYPGSTWV